MEHFGGGAGKLAGEALQNFLNLVFRHGSVGLVVKGVDRFAVFLSPDHAAKGKYGPIRWGEGFP
jgi:hypothetical protein